jgi:hypothetical protein
MWIICGELQDGLSDELGETDSSLIASTRELIRDVSRGRGNYADNASSLFAAWDQQCTHIDTDEVPHGLAALWTLCQELIGEVTGDSGKNVASGWIMNVVTERWRTPEERMRVEFPVYDPNEEIDDASPLGQYIKRLQWIVASAASYSGDLDPVLMREKILGK